MIRPWSQILLAAVVLFAAQNAFAVEKVYIFEIDGATELPPNASPGTGFARVTVDLDTSMMRVEASFADLLSTTTAAHIHCCNFDAQGGASVATQTPTFPGFPSGVTSGSMDETYDMTLSSSYRAGFLSTYGGSIPTAFNALLAGMDSGMAYFNIHTSSFPGGEIRGLAQLIPEPASAMLCAIGLVLPLGLRRRTRS